jgi:predicted metal-dependent RNase
MPVEEALTDLKERVKERLPPNINITELEFEGPEVVIYTDDPRAFADNGEIVKKLARELRKRIVVRPDPRVLADPETSIKAKSSLKKQGSQTTILTSTLAKSS